MSFLNRIQARSIGLNNLVKPKGFAHRMASGEEPPVEEVAQALRRQEEVTEDKPEATPAAALRRDTHDEGSGQADKAEALQEEEVQSLHRESVQQQEEDPVAQALRRQQEAPLEEEAAQALRRQQEAPLEEEAVQALHRQAAHNHTEAPANPLRREILEHNEEEGAQALQRETAPANLNAENSEPPAELNEEPSASPLTALHRDMNIGAVAAPASSPTDLGWTMPEAVAVSDPVAVSQPAALNTPLNTTVQIDHIDVLVQEPGMSTFRQSGPNHSRSIRTRYLRRL